jgi:phospholipid-binding lipoprotein MlaA
MPFFLLFAVLLLGTGTGVVCAQAADPVAASAAAEDGASAPSESDSIEDGDEGAGDSVPAVAPAAGPEGGGDRAASASADADFAEFDDEFGEEASVEAGTKKVFDPLRGYNRLMFRVNDKFYFWFAKPLARGYGFLVPEPARASFGKAFYNLRFPLRFVGSLFQLKFKKAGTELGRFVVNSTMGVGGLFDPADRWLGWQRPSEEDLGQILGHYGVGDGFPIVLPLLGQTNLRDGLATVPEFFLNPVWYVADTPTNLGVSAGEQFNFISLHIGEYESIKKDALDPYTFVRDAYKQNRDKKIRE